MDAIIDQYLEIALERAEDVLVLSIQNRGSFMRYWERKAGRICSSYILFKLSIEYQQNACVNCLYV
ncbi:MAG: hypothetical protein GX383_02035 [Clostridium sp.]|nr:hypothetical protein [Clostridium sp.]